MSETKHEFLLDLYVTEAFDVVTREGLPVMIGAINTLVQHGHQIIVWLELRELHLRFVFGDEINPSRTNPSSLISSDAYFDGNNSWHSSDS